MSDVNWRLSLYPTQTSMIWQLSDKPVNLVVTYNDPKEDIDFARGKPNSEVLVGKIAGKLVASVMVEA